MDRPFGVGPRPSLPTSSVSRCSLCAGAFRSGPLAGKPYPPCLACREAFAREGVVFVARQRGLAYG